MPLAPIVAVEAAGGAAEVSIQLFHIEAEMVQHSVAPITVSDLPAIMVIRGKLPPFLYPIGFIFAKIKIAEPFRV